MTGTAGRPSVPSPPPGPTPSPATGPVSSPSPSAPVRRALLCPGQGTQKPGMLAPWLADDAPQADAVISFLAKAARATDLDLVELGTRADAAALRETAVTQPLVVATSLVGALVAGLLPAPGTVVAGHSLGSITALAVAGVLTPVEAVRLAAQRGQAMARCSAEVPGTMVALVGGVRAEVLAAIEEAACGAANVNGSRQVVAAGPPEAVATLRRTLPDGVRALPLSVAGAFHTEAMAGARPTLAAAVARLHPSPPVADLVDEATGTLIPAGSAPEALLDALVDKLTLPVRWDLVQARLTAVGTGAAVELPPVGVLAGMARTDLPGVAVTRLCTPAEAVGCGGEVP